MSFVKVVLKIAHCKLTLTEHEVSLNNSIFAVSRSEARDRLLTTEEDGTASMDSAEVRSV
jgi:hypothetical protein